MPKTIGNTRQRREKPAKPFAAFPLFAHANGSWSKKVRGKLYYFGPWDSPQAALELWEAREPYLRTGREPPNTSPQGPTVRELVNSYLTSKQRQLDSRELKTRTFSDYHAICTRILDVFGKDRPIDDLRPDDFGKLRTRIAKGCGPVATAGQIKQSKMVFAFAFKNGVIDKPVSYGSQFDAPSRRTMRKAKNDSPPQEFTAHEILSLKDLASVQMRAMILLGINCGLGNSDIANLHEDNLDFPASFLRYPRPKTHVQRRCPLWPETIDVLRRAIADRPAPRDPAYRGLVFLTTRGVPWVRCRDKERDGNGKPIPLRNGGKSPTLVTSIDVVKSEFRKLKDTAGIKRPGCGFYTLRHVHRTISDEINDRPACDLIMGHENTNDIRTAYVTRVADERLSAITDHIHGWLFDGVD